MWRKGLTVLFTPAVEDLRSDLHNLVTVIVVIVLEVGLGGGSKSVFFFGFLLCSRFFRNLNVRLLHLQLAELDIQDIRQDLHIEQVVSGEREGYSAGHDGEEVLDDHAVKGERHGRGVTAGDAGYQVGEKATLES